MLRRTLRFLAIAAIVLFVAGCIAFAIISKPRPEGVSGLDAERISNEMLLAVNAAAWQQTGAVRFTFLNHHHLWDRRRNYDRIESGKRMVLLRISDRTGRAWENGSEADSSRSTELVSKAYEEWVNDSFWLNPVVKIFDRGATRSIVRDDSGRATLLIEYASGGMTPGDAYLWTPGANGAPPTEWKIWAQALLIGGLTASWEGWITLSTGARVSTLHRIGPFTLKLTDVAGAKTLSELLGNTHDPFFALNK